MTRAVGAGGIRVGWNGKVGAKGEIRLR